MHATRHARGGALPLLHRAPALLVPRSGKTCVAGGGAQPEPPESKSCGPCRVAALPSRDGPIVAPLRGFCWFPLATGGFAAIHPRLFDLRRSAAVCRTIRTTRPANGNASIASSTRVTYGVIAAQECF